MPFSRSDVLIIAVLKLFGALNEIISLHDEFLSTTGVSLSIFISSVNA